VVIKSLAVSTHGRYLVVPGRAAERAPLLVGFHGYAEPAEAAFDRLVSIAPAGEWHLVAVQGLHRFYSGRSQDVVASWMTSQDRDQAIADNIEYVRAVVREETGTPDPGAPPRLVFTGFSQGVAMAFRAGAALGCAGVIACGGDVPPELDAAALSRIGRVLIGRGNGDEWYTAAKLDDDAARLRAAGIPATPLTFQGGHEWAPSFVEPAAGFLAGLR